MTAHAQPHEPSNAELAAALEQFEIQQLKDQLRQQRIAHTEEISAIKRQAEQEPLERIIERWNGYPAAIERAEKAEADLAKARAEHASVTDTLNVVADNCAKFEQLADHYKDQCEKMLAKNNANVDKATETIERLQRQVRELNTQIRTYREMNPDRLQKQVKRLQEKNRTQQATIDEQKRQLGEKSGEIKTLKKVEHQLRQHNANLNAALDDACNVDLTDTRIWHDEEWAVSGHEDAPLRLFIVHQPTGERRVYDKEKGLIRAKSVPQYVKDMAKERIERYSLIDQHMKEMV